MLEWVLLSLVLIAQQDSQAEDLEVDPLPEFDPQDYTYNPFGKRDPFRSFLRDAEEEAPSENPLLNYDLSKFKLSGIVRGMADPRAIVLDGSNRGHIIRQGTRIGRNEGRVTRILRDQVVVTEEFRDPLGKLIVQEYTMKLNEEE